MDHANQTPKGRSTVAPTARAPTPPLVRAARRRAALASREGSAQSTTKRPPNSRDDERASKKLRGDTTVAGTPREVRHGTPGTAIGQSKPVQGHIATIGSTRKLGSAATNIQQSTFQVASADPARRLSSGGGAGLSTMKGMSWAPILQQQQQQQQLQQQQRPAQDHVQQQVQEYTPTPTTSSNPFPFLQHAAPLQTALHSLPQAQPQAQPSSMHPIHDTNIHQNNVPNPLPSPSPFPPNHVGPSPLVANGRVNYTNLLFDTQRQQQHRLPSDSPNPNPSPSWRYNTSPHEHLPSLVREVMSPTRRVPSTNSTGTVFFQMEGSAPSPVPGHAPAPAAGPVYDSYGHYGYPYGQGHPSYAAGAPFNQNPDPNPNLNPYPKNVALHVSTSQSAYTHHQGQGQGGAQAVEDKSTGVRGNGEKKDDDDQDKQEEGIDSTPSDNSKGKKPARSMNQTTFDLLVQLVEQNRELKSQVAGMHREYIGMSRRMANISETLGVEDASESEDECPVPPVGVASTSTSTSTSAPTITLGSTGTDADAAIDVDALPDAPPAANGAGSMLPVATTSKLAVKKAKRRRPRRTILERLETIEQDVAECTEGLRDPEANLPPIDPDVNPSVESATADTNMLPLVERTTREMGVRSSLPPASQPPPSSSASNIFTFGPSTSSSTTIPTSYPFSFNWPRGAIIDVRLPTPVSAQEDTDGQSKDNDAGNNADNENIGKPLIRVHGAGSMGAKFLEMARMLLGDGHVELVQEADTNVTEDQSDRQSREPVHSVQEEKESREEDEAPLGKQAEGNMEVVMEVGVEIEEEKEDVTNSSGEVANIPMIIEEPETPPRENTDGVDLDIIMGDGDGAVENDGTALGGVVVEEAVVADEAISEAVEAPELRELENHQAQTEQDETQVPETAEPKVQQDAVEPERQPEADTTEQSQVNPPVVPQDEPRHVEDIVPPQIDVRLQVAKESSPTHAATEPIIDPVEQKSFEEVATATEPGKGIGSFTGEDLSPPLSPALESTPPLEDEQLSDDLISQGGDVETEAANPDNVADESEDDEDVQIDLSPEELAMVTHQSRGIVFAVRTAEATSTSRTTPAICSAPLSTVTATSLSLSTSELASSFEPLPVSPVSQFDKPSASVGSEEATEDEISNWSDTQDEEKQRSVETERAAPVSNTTASSSATLVEADAEVSTNATPTTKTTHIPEKDDASVTQEVSSFLVSNTDGFAASSVLQAFLMTSKTPEDTVNGPPTPLSHLKTPASLGKIDLRTIQRRKTGTPAKLNPAPHVHEPEEEAVEDTPIPKFTANVDWSKTTPTKTSGAAVFTPTAETRVLRSGRATPTRSGLPLSLGGFKTPIRATSSSLSMTPPAQSVPIAANVASTPSPGSITVPKILETSKPSTSNLSPHEKAARATAERAIKGLLQAQARSPDKDFSMPVGRKTPTPSPSKSHLRQSEPSPLKTYSLRGPSEGTMASLRQQILGNNHMRASLASKPSYQAVDKVITASIQIEAPAAMTAEVVSENERGVDMDADPKITTPAPTSLSTTMIDKDDVVGTSVHTPSDTQVPVPMEVEVALMHQSSTTPQEPLSQASSNAPHSSLTSLTTQPSISALDEEDVESLLMDDPPTSPVRQTTAEPPEVDIEVLSTPVAFAKASTGRLKPRPKPRLSIPPAPEVIYIESSPEGTPKKLLTRITRSRKSSPQPPARDARASASSSIMRVDSVISISSSSDDALAAPPSTKAKGKQRESLATLTPKPEFNTTYVQSSTPKQLAQKLESSKDGEVERVSAPRRKPMSQFTRDLRDMSPLSDIPDDIPAPPPASARKVREKRGPELIQSTREPLQSNTIEDSDDEDRIIVKKRRIPSGSNAITADGSAAAGMTGGLRKASLLVPAKKGQSAAATRVIRKRKAPMDPDAEANMPPLKRVAIRAASRAVESKDTASASTPKPTSSSMSTSTSTPAPASGSGSTTTVQSESRSGSVLVKEKSRLQGKLAGPSPSRRVKVELLSGNGRTPTRVRPARTATVAWPPIPVPNLTESIECDLCNRWYHWGCAGVNADDPRILPSEIYKCPPCQEGVSVNESGTPKKDSKSTSECARPKCPTLLAASKQSRVNNSARTYPVESFVGKRKLMISGAASGKIQFLVKWLDYPFAENTWETTEDLNLPNHDILIQAFEQEASKEGVDFEELSWNEPVYLFEAVKGGWGPDGEFTQP
ncbi:hypothetical protein D9619_007943 [Psilocybe cf. subviscida]|uniref:Chromo domain-containing protein n=1 Tax=Psilocybe cf. subviscida TaxID=2480587 RepID=A0A8H5AUE5_9AGAR|nr:hypothetical protein D9619_007943 [Psilocybe cf. subviscida]